MDKMTLKQWNEYIARSNEDFLKASPDQQRITLARDVLWQLKKKRIVPQAGTWMDTGKESLPKDMDRQMKDILKEQETCEACLLGALTTAVVERVNEMTVRQSGSKEDDMLGLSQTAVFSHLSKFFEPEQYKLMEMAFEKGHGWFDGYSFTDPDAAGEAATFHNMEDEFEEDDPAANAFERMRLILENIVVNSGTFKPLQRPVLDEKAGNYYTPGYVEGPDPITVEVVS